MILRSPRWILCLKQVKFLEVDFYAAYKHLCHIWYLPFVLKSSYK